jgi:hypothetical protein
MNTSASALVSKIMLSAILSVLCILLPIVALAQETDTTRQELDLDTEVRQVNTQQQLDRSMSDGTMSSMGTYNVPQEGQYYDHPFMGQKYLDAALKAYREQMKQRSVSSWYTQFFRSVSPFFGIQLGSIEGQPVDIVGRDNPLFQSYKKDERQ